MKEIDNIMNKEFIYRGFKFNIKVELHTKSEKCMNGRSWHTVTINCMDRSNFYFKTEVEDKDLIPHIKGIEVTSKNHVDINLDGVLSKDQRLTDLGFK